MHKYQKTSLGRSKLVFLMWTSAVDFDIINYGITHEEENKWRNNMKKHETVRIAICDDQLDVHLIMKNHIDKYEKEKNISCETVSIQSAKELLEYEDRIDILILDIMMPEMDGFEIAQELNNKKQNLKIIMLSGDTKRFKEAFIVGAVRFVTKPVEQSELFEALDKAREDLFPEEKVSVYKNGIECRISQNDIIYLSAEDGVVHIYTNKNDYVNYDSLRKWSEILDETLFFSLHRAYIVNLNKISQVDKEYVYLETGERIPIARRKYSELVRKMAE